VREFFVADVRADGVAVYVWRRGEGGVELLQVHRSEATGEYQHSWQIVYGGIEKGETAVQAAVRELKEETGLTARGMFQVEYVETFYFRPKDYVLMMPVFAVEVGMGDTITLNEEHDAFRWVKAGAMEEHFMWRTQREAVRIILQEIQRPGLAMGMLKIF
jgi:8-oxo-dGTP pyrophosphatase MutT (NUDIX family)